MRNYLSFLVLLFSTFVCSQGIVVDTVTYSNQDLVRNVLVTNGCITTSNFSASSRLSVGYFNKASSNFPLNEGIIIRSGKAKFTQGQYTGNNISSQVTTNGDAALQGISNASGQTATITDAAFLQFDFVPISSQFSFDFLFASNEYGQYQCGFSDVFAFLLTDLGTGVTTNLAVLPGTTTPVTVKNIRNNAFNPQCNSNNPGLFGKYNVTNPALSDIDMRGQTKVLTAASAVTPGTNYQIRLVIGDYRDSNFDSAVFIKGGSFVTTINLGADQSYCTGESIILQTGLSNAFTFQWYLNNNPIPGATGANYVVTQAGTYKVIATVAASGCVITDEIVFAPLVVANPQDLYTCYSGNPQNNYNLNTNNYTALAISSAIYTLEYFTNSADAAAHTNAIPTAQLGSFSAASGQTIYIKIKKNATATYCDAVYTFQLIEKPQIVLATPYTANVCENALPVNLLTQNPTVLNGLTAASYSVQYFTSALDAQNNTAPIGNSYTPPAGATTFTIFVRVDDLAISGCFATTSINFTINPAPPVDPSQSVFACSTYALPALTNGNYFTLPNGGGTQITLPFTATDSGTYYIFNGPTPQGCVKESTLSITMIDEYIIPTAACDIYTVPTPPRGDFFTGPSGTGTLIAPGTTFTTNQSFYYYAVINGVVCRDEVVNISVFPSPVLSPIANVVACNSYNLPSLSQGNYYITSGGTGQIIPVNSQIQYTQIVLPNNTTLPITMPLTLFNYIKNSNDCSDQESFTVNIVDPSQYIPKTSCGSYSLPVIAVGGYFSQPNGQGNSINPATPITTSQIVYYFVATTTGSNCSTNLNYDITINPNAPIDNPASFTNCGSYILPALTNGKYYTAANGGGNEVLAGTEIATTTQLFVYATNGTCPSNWSFTITIKTPVLVDSFSDEFPCAPSFTLRALTNGKYFTGPQGTGAQKFAGDVITTTTVLYIYNDVLPDATYCTSETVYNIFMDYVDVGTFNAVQACDSYVLPTLTIGNYFNQPGGISPITNTTLTASQTVYVYAEKGDRVKCTSEANFVVTISTTPTAVTLANQTACGSFVLQPLPANQFYYTAINGSSGTGTLLAAGTILNQNQTVFVYAVSPSNPNCFTQTSFQLNITPRPTLAIPNGIICVDFVTGSLQKSYTIVSGVDATQFICTWYLSNVLVGTGPTYTALVEGVYTLKTIKIIPEDGINCNYSDTLITISKSSPPLAEVQLSEYFTSDTAATVINLQGFGTYVFSVDGNPFQTSETFTGLTSGDHAITIRDIKNDCGQLILPFSLINYPHFFTPNGDGFNDTWNIFDLAFKPDSRITIFDRFGKLIKQIGTGSNGWDGTFNGKTLPSTDYWFVLDYQLGGIAKQFKGHFALKR